MPWRNERVQNLTKSGGHVVNADEAPRQGFFLKHTRQTRSKLGVTLVLMWEGGVGSLVHTCSSTSRECLPQTAADP